MRIAGFCQERGACTTLRIKQPLMRIKELNLAETELILAADGTTEGIIRSADVVVLGRAASEHVLDIVQRMQAFGKKVVFDLDDSMFDVSVMSPHYQSLGTMQVNFENPDGSKGDVWMDGKSGFDAKRNRKIRLSFIRLLRQADCVTVTTPPLEKLYSRYNDNVKIVPNAINFMTWDKLNFGWNGKEIRLLYTGAANHFEDWLFVAPVLEELQKKYPQLTIVLVGTDWKTSAPDNLDRSRVEVHRWVDFEAYPYLMKSLCCHIGIAPVSKSDFNDCRSELKWVEYSALKMATVATRWGPYQRSIKDGVTGLLADEREDWVEALSKLIEDETLRKTLGESAYRECRKKFNLDNAVDQWMDVFTGVLGAKT